MSTKTRREQIEDLLAHDPKDAFLRYALAMEHVSAGDHASAAGMLQALLADSPEYVAGYFQCGQALIRLGRTEEARQVLERGVIAARRAGEVHAAEEIQGLLAALSS